MDRIPTQQQYVSRKTLAIKRGDSEILTRNDVQYAFLYHVFNDKTLAFTDETPGKPPAKVNFCDLYVHALYNSAKCSKVMKDKMLETPAFAVEFAKISLLTNVGRINTTMAFFPEMKTALRSYHPVPSLQKTDGNVQDAPRIKNCLKAAFLPGEQKSAPPSTPADILARAKAGHIPPTSVVNLIFVLVNYSSSLMPLHFEPDVEFVDLFLPINISSAARARAFLWMIFHYHEGPNLANPFADDHARRNLGKVPWLLRLSREEQAQENVDPPEELEWGRKMAQTRSRFLQELVAGGELDKTTRTLSGSSSHDIVDAEPSSARRSRTQQYYPSDGSRTTFHHYIPTNGGKVKSTQSMLPAVHASMRTGEHWLEHRDNYSLLHQAWHRVQNTDPLADSDDEGLDEHARLDYQRRLHVLDLIRQPSTPHFASG
ncbi:hypothetical protein EDB92DRAFT_1813970 [Lactarius akahatsu]|uniref:Ino eighty subunit 1 n=1 Tax=Lactarius akahatsu TaxID=416441 RepID=A0AAD4QB70_9AGAM|nr:hypothetical protein EDB92DRAFT_1813970 [Lactarius akahatsu]